ncbi:DUF4219 domain-containing protein/UBN2 domain-containing protein [Cephalotus follicularis]|uniref:DUF4219 domain-containing protein/UBN2 domain-containing protein n=1 Tax=Cephalotus follicularis TaxID=3775 RepID=A0A1Q3AZZ9_CEPFO|nr:DUF4219 domain-containing protein/UBN2 domain-containing protein [Cephalotus follicularis]
MAANGSNLQQSMIPIFKGENYEFWSIKMKTLFRSQELWEIVEDGVPPNEDQGRMRELKKRDAKALFFIQQGLHETVFSRVSAAETAKEAWDTLRNEFQGTTKVKAVKLQTLRRNFETLQMNAGESIQDFFSRGMTVVNQMRSYGEKISLVHL